MSLSRADGSAPPPGLETTVSCARTADALFVVFRAHLKDIRYPPGEGPQRKTKTLRLWEQSDVLELFLGRRARSTRSYGEFQVAPDGRWLDTRVRIVGTDLHLDTAWDSGLEVKSFVAQEQRMWRAALKIPWRSLCDGDPASDVWEGNIYRACGREQGNELLAWSPTGFGEGCFHRPEKFGKFELK